MNDLQGEVRATQHALEIAQYRYQLAERAHDRAAMTILRAQIAMKERHYNEAYRTYREHEAMTNNA